MSNSDNTAQLEVVFPENLFGLNKDRPISLSSARFVIGRASGCDLCIDNARISRQHTEVILEGERYWVADCGSFNGTFLNGNRLVGTLRHILRDRDEIQVGSYLALRFRDAAATLADPRPVQLRRGLWVGTTKEDVYVNFKLVEPPVTTQQFLLLKALMERPGEVVKLDEIAYAIWPEEKVMKEGIGDPRIHSLVARLRQRLGRLDSEHEYIESFRSKGLRFVQRK